MSGRCAEVRDLMHPFLDGELEVDRNVEVLKHFELCTPCRERCDAERGLREAITRAGAEPLDEVTRARLFQGALGRVEAEDAEEAAQASRSKGGRWVRGLALAAGILLAVSVGAFSYMDPLCVFGGCNTRQQIEQVFVASQDAGTSEGLPSGVSPLGPCLGVQEKGCVVVDSPGLPQRVARELTCKKSGKRMRLLQIPGGHLHGWELKVHKDGRRYFQGKLACGARVVAWQTTGGVSACVQQSKDMPADALYVMAAAVRDSGA